MTSQTEPGRGADAERDGANDEENSRPAEETPPASSAPGLADPVQIVAPPATDEMGAPTAESGTTGEVVP